MKDNFKRHALQEARAALTALGLEPYRGDQVYKWIWQKNAKDFSVMTDLSKELRADLGRRFVIEGPRVLDTRQYGSGVRKYLLACGADENIESVYIHEGRRRTVCVSSQVGCPLGCKFCATALLGFKRDLQAYEIADQVRLVEETAGVKCTNVVFMGMGEPLLNFDAVVAALETITSPLGLAIGRRHTTLSTVGIVEGMEALLRAPVRVKLAVSLNFADEEQRKEYMPAARRNRLADILKIARAYSRLKERVTFEYVMIRGLNDRVRDAAGLISLLRSIPSKINLIPYNEHPLLPYKRPAEDTVERFRARLLASEHTVVIRKSRGQEILAGCGQLSGAVRVLTSETKSV